MMITQVEISQLTRVEIDLAILDKLKADVQTLPEGISELIKLDKVFKHVRHSLENEVRVLVKEFKALETELERLRQENEGLRKIDVA